MAYFADQEKKEIIQNYTHKIHHALNFAFSASATEGLDRLWIETTSLVVDHKNLDHTFGAAFVVFVAFAAVVKSGNSALDLVAYLLGDHFLKF
jgi:hypothetical protein